jgi:hypothetical protein
MARAGVGGHLGVDDHDFVDQYCRAFFDAPEVLIAESEPGAVATGLLYSLPSLSSEPDPVAAAPGSDFEM